MKRVLGLDIGVASIGFSLIDVLEKDGKTEFNNLTTNSIIFDVPELAEERRKGRSSRRLNDRKSRRKQHIRNLFFEHGLTDKSFVTEPSSYLNTLDVESDVYILREKALHQDLSKAEFIKALYSITTRRGYSNQFESTEQDENSAKENEKINGSISKNIQLIKEKGFILPTELLTYRRTQKEELGYQNIPVRNKGGNYTNSLNRKLHEDELKIVIFSQKDNRNIFASEEKCEKFYIAVRDVMMEQRPLKSFEDMVAYCSYFDKYHETPQKRMSLSSIYNIELTLKQSLSNYKTMDKKSGEIISLSKKQIDEVVAKWVNEPTSDKITFANIFTKTSLKNCKLNDVGGSAEVLNIKGFRELSAIFKQYNVDFYTEHRDFFEKALLILSYYKNISKRVEELQKSFTGKLEPKDEFINEVAKVSSIDGFGSFSVRFAKMVLEKMEQGNSFSEALESLGYFDKYLGMPAYDYLPPFNPTQADIKWLKENLSYFDTKHLYYKANSSKTVERIISVMRKLINDIIKKYGKIDEIAIEGGKELNSKKEEDKIKENQKDDKKINDEAKNLLKDKNIKDYDNPTKVRKAKMLIEQKYKCLYSNEPLTLKEALDEEECEIEHFIPRSHFWNNSQKNTILVLKKHNQNKTDVPPMEYLKQIGKWEDYKAAVHNSSMKESKKDWLTNEEKIEAIFDQDTNVFLANYLNDTRSSIKIIKNYLEHYLYPKTNRYGKDEQSNVRVVSAKAINELKHIWGIKELITSEDTGKKDRTTNYHHSIDALTVALCDKKGMFALHNFFKQKENKFKTKAMKENVSKNVPFTSEGETLHSFCSHLVEKYKNNELYVCPYNKIKTNKKGFKDGNKKLVVAQNSKGVKQLQELKNISLLPYDLLQEKKQLKVTDRTDEGVRMCVQEIVSQLDIFKQKGIREALPKYGEFLIAKRAEEEKFSVLEKELVNKQKADKKKEDVELSKQIDEIKSQLQSVRDEIAFSNCYFVTKNGTKQIVKGVKNLSDSETKASTVLIQNGNSILMEKLNIETFKQAQEEGHPFVCKENDYTVSVDIYSSSKHQIIGLKYFRSIENDIEPNFKESFQNIDKQYEFSIHKGEVVVILDEKEKVQYLAVANGGGQIAGTNHKIQIENINTNGVVAVTINKKTIIKKAKIDFYGNFQIG
ncbi:type II CRISPR RNA-guided endonuclease Cas9 [Sulfurimonas lithotrophica]|uniref:CRISPR-associated endonuclease Cas9 n=1 Tax=Sulfurimonas lithotrophica TaxID=2590022 RepID=A0A5P8P328_9BACT|nr:type II CRISPR RNA-guided endonuclease Cas9 [Sulfurimonas lithotrophica]QFR50163.1 type II CRISPR RNA-guided endonuclease Cas9 [Sulfurimonas lithotrophica]